MTRRSYRSEKTTVQVDLGAAFTRRNAPEYHRRSWPERPRIQLEAFDPDHAAEVAMPHNSLRRKIT